MYKDRAELKLDLYMHNRNKHAQNVRRSFTRWVG